MDSFLLSFKEKRGSGVGEEGIGEEDEGHSEKIPESRWLSPPPSLKWDSSQKNGKPASTVCVITICQIVSHCQIVCLTLCVQL